MFEYELRVTSKPSDKKRFITNSNIHNTIKSAHLKEGEVIGSISLKRFRDIEERFRLKTPYFEYVSYYPLSTHREKLQGHGIASYAEYIILKELASKFPNAKINDTTREAISSSRQNQLIKQGIAPYEKVPTFKERLAKVERYLRTHKRKI